VIKAVISDNDASELASELVSGYTEAEEEDGTLEKAVEELGYFIVCAVRDFNEEQDTKADIARGKAKQGKP
jgi:hypothetical protein